LITLQFVVVVMHDWVEIPGWSHGRQVQAAIGRRKLALATLINATFPATALALAVAFWNRPTPSFATTYWVVYCAVTLGSAIAMWYIPYLFGAPETTRLLYSRMYANTRQALPARGDNPRPNLLHVCFHVLFVVTFLLALAVRFHVTGG
jgi:hypothetical protein